MKAFVVPEPGDDPQKVAAVYAALGMQSDQAPAARPDGVEEFLVAFGNVAGRRMLSMAEAQVAKRLSLATFDALTMERFAVLGARARGTN